MPKADKKHTVPLRAAQPQRRARPAPKVPGADMPRTIWHLGGKQGDAEWAKRSLESKTLCIISETARRLRGLVDVLYADALRDASGVHRTIFLGGSVNDLVLTLERLEKAWHDKWELDDAASLARCEAKERAERAAKRTKAPATTLEGEAA